MNHAHPSALEFPRFAEEIETPRTRRKFLKLMGASVAMAGAASCRWPSEEIVPFARRPDGYVPGVPLHYLQSLQSTEVLEELRPIDRTGLFVRNAERWPRQLEKLLLLYERLCLKAVELVWHRSPLQLLIRN